VVGILVAQKLLGPILAVFTVVRTNIGFIFKIRYYSGSPSLSTGLASMKTLAMVSTGSRVNVPFGIKALFRNETLFWDKALFRDSVTSGHWAAGKVWNIRACGQRVAETHRHQHAQTGFQTQNKLVAATNEKPCLKPCLADVPCGVFVGAVQS